MWSPGVGLAGPILAGMEEQWRRFWQELACEPGDGYDDLRRRLGITGQRVWLVRTRGGAFAVCYLECVEPDTVVSRLAASTEPYDLEFKANLIYFHGCDFDRLVLGCYPELIFAVAGPMTDLPRRP
ncbi:MAG TPA: hypothetical protein VEQ66_05290 [Propionibacteriaceae bacterium]|nr:hypothetical protein [Propionibacteriaceae bacterium]